MHGENDTRKSQHKEVFPAAQAQARLHQYGGNRQSETPKEGSPTSDSRRTRYDKLGKKPRPTGKNHRDVELDQAKPGY